MMRRQSDKFGSPAPEYGPSDTDPEIEDVLAEDSYFTYRPLSSLPTPPQSSRDSVTHSALENAALDDNGDPMDERLLGPAVHMVNLIPASASLAKPSVSHVQAILGRAGLSLETMALAVCVLDSLDARFARTWRLSCPLQAAATPTLTPDSPSSATFPSPPSASSNKRHTLPPAPTSLAASHKAYQQRQLHIDLVSPELIVVSALVIAAKFTDDCHKATHFYCEHWGNNVWTPDQLNVTERCIMESLDYRIMPLYEDGCLTDAMVDMRLAAEHHMYAHAHAHAHDCPRLRPRVPASFSSSSHSRSKTLAPMSSGDVLRAFGTAPAPTGSAQIPEATEPTS